MNSRVSVVISDFLAGIENLHLPVPSLKDTLFQSKSDTPIYQFYNDFISFYEVYLPPMLNWSKSFLDKPYIDSTISYNLTYGLFYGLVGGTKTSTQYPFLEKAGVVMAAKIFANFVEPAFKQVVENTTKQHLVNLQYLHQKLNCWIDDDACIEIIKQQVTFSHLNEPLEQAIGQFDFQTYQLNLINAVQTLSISRLTVSGLTSATADEIKNYVFDFVGASSYCNNYLCKKWIAPTIKDTINDVLKSQIPLILNDSPAPPKPEVDNSTALIIYDNKNMDFNHQEHIGPSIIFIQVATITSNFLQRPNGDTSINDDFMSDKPMSSPYEHQSNTLQTNEILSSNSINKTAEIFFLDGVELSMSLFQAPSCVTQIPEAIGDNFFF